MLSTDKKVTPRLIKWGSYLGLLGIILVLHACHQDDENDILEKNYKVHNSEEEASFITQDIQDTVVVFDFDTKKETVKIVTSKKDIYLKPDVMPSFPGCDGISDLEERKDCSNKKLLTFIYSNLKYPKEAKDLGIEGMAVVKFIIGDDGALYDEKIVKEIGGGTSEAIFKVITKMKEDNIIWTPGRVNGKNVDVKFTLPIKFKLED